MDYRTKNFIEKFTSAQKYLGTRSIQNIVSLKYRDNVGYSDYQRLIDELPQGEIKLEIKQIQGKFQGKAWLVKDKNQNAVILVEHETGLEILSIAADIISLLAIFPVINSGWRFIRDRFANSRSHRDRMTEIEVRTINSKKQLSEKHVIDIENYVLEESLKEVVVLKAKVKQLEKEIAKINNGKKVQTKKPKSPAKKRTK